MFVRNDIRLVGLLRRLTNPRYAANVEKNLGNASRYIDVEMLLTLAVAAREYSESVGATGTAMIETFHQGGMDHLGKNKDKLGLPHTVTNRWQAVQPYPNAEIPNKNPPGQPPSNMIYPAMIPAEDQVMAYAAQMKTSFTNAFNKFWRSLPADEYPRWIGCRVALMVWRAYAFLAPGGSDFDTKLGLAQQLGQGFGVHKALGYLRHTATPGDGKQLDRIVSDSGLNQSEWIRIAKVRVAEALYVEYVLQNLRGVSP